ncbi:MAG TPA: hypothetical protein DC048_04330, partial [Planctomycetaceae bacterium]|nr:hypothetical protein [Planctomycetaceae bacterium]
MEPSRQTRHVADAGDGEPDDRVIAVALRRSLLVAAGLALVGGGIWSLMRPAPSRPVLSESPLA